MTESLKYFAEICPRKKKNHKKMHYLTAMYISSLKKKKVHAAISIRSGYYLLAYELREYLPYGPTTRKFYSLLKVYKEY
mgnify:CR=1 FL=1